MAKLADLVVDCRQPAKVARFWAGLLEGYEVAPYDTEEIERLAALGVDDVENDPTVLVQPTTAGQPRLFFVEVPESKIIKNRIHFDVRADDPDAEIQRAVALGAQVVGRSEGWVTMIDVEGNEFDVLLGD